MIGKIIALIIYIIIAAIVIHYSQGRISRNSYLKALLFTYAGLLIYWIFSIIMLYVFKIFLFCVIGFIGTCVVSFILWKLQILRLHDLNYSGWYILMDYIPFVNLYFLCIRLLKERTDLLNDFDESIDYLSLLKKTHLYPSINIIKIDGPNFYLDEIRFEYAKYKDQLQFQVSVMSLEEHKHIEEYCKKNLIQTENSPSYTEKYDISFLADRDSLNKLKKDLNAIVEKNNFLQTKKVQIFIRKDFDLYEIVYKKEFADSVKQLTAAKTINDYCCQTLNKSQLTEFIKSIV